MGVIETIERIVFWCCVGGVVYAYAVYPVVIWALSRVFGAAPRANAADGGAWPRVELLIAAHNERDVIGARLGNALAVEYPKDRFGVVVAS